MRIDGIDAEVLHPNHTMRAFCIPDQNLPQAVCQAYDDWVSDFCRAHPEELLGIAVVPAFDVDWAIRECHREKKG